MNYTGLQQALARFQGELQVWLEGLFPLYTSAKVQYLPGCVFPLGRLELQRHELYFTISLTFACSTIKLGFPKQ